MVFNSRVLPVFMSWLPKISGLSIDTNYETLYTSHVTLDTSHVTLDTNDVTSDLNLMQIDKNFHLN